MDIHKVLDQIDEIIYIADLENYELLYLNRIGRERFGTPAPGVKCYEFLQGEEKPCKFCTNGELSHLQDKHITWVRQHSAAGNMLLHDSIIDYGGRPCRMELAISVERYVAEVAAAKQDLAAERKLVKCIENLVLSTDFDAAVNSMLETILEHYSADRAYIFEFDWTRDVTHNTYEICRDGVTPEKDNLQNLPIEVVALWVDIFRNQHRKINIIEDVDALKDDPARRIEYDCLHPQGIKSLITVPIFVSGELHGFLGVDNPHAHMDAPEMLAQITYVAANELQKRTLTDELTVKSYLDPLTGLRNRLAYDEALGYLLGKEIPTGVGFLDLNGLKWINDNLGHDMGNKALRRVCEILLKYIQKEYVYRISGDEFVIIWTDVEYPIFNAAAEQLEAALVEEKDIASFGFVWGAEEDVGVAVRKAEQAMQAAKNKFYASNTDLKGQRPGYLDLLLKEFRDSTFIPYLQPLYSIQYDRVYGAEVLVRKIDPHGNIHPPVEFIKVMEKEHMISMVDLEMLRQSCELLQKWKAWPDLVLNVNVSRNTLVEPDYLTQVDKIFADTGVDPRRLIFEITESSQGIQLESLSRLLDELRARGITLAIDDLGTEAACLEMLYLPQIGVAKIDRSLICKAEHSPREQTVIRHLIDLCHDLGMRCVAEGIETDSQIELLKQLGCDRLQGYKIGKPMPAADFFHQFVENALHK
ncbi:GGDEF domain-containing protein [Butyricicoccus sp. AF15-40]|jgi:diguanylate cyclase (GGDEF)-like protein|nr:MULTISPECIES: GGDEF domain-containing protein [unclassified Butyricicoccus]RGM80077.1 GGDEF domain-containing protein [Butyricicoccus sp. OM06-6AC]RHQ73812.1 GGDEF domain-containing protein [Butyricicoccus sp. AF24-19AC]RHR88894.1 GGDEF domain-containing protein [Butyricicoccus sp. AF15-40]RHT78951.1 GGDEF domain-containing protein [Butyricicoccus sp. AM28-25]